MSISFLNQPAGRLGHGNGVEEACSATQVGSIRAGEELSTAIETSEQYTLEIKVSESRKFRNTLKNLSRQAKVALTADELELVQASFRGELRNYRDIAQKDLNRLQQELSSTAALMQDLSEKVNSSGGNHQTAVRAELETLEQAAKDEDLQHLRRMVQKSAAAITRSCQELESSNHLIITQLRDEIRTLHREAEKERRALQTDEASGAWNRQRMDSKITDLVMVNQPFSVFIIGIRNYHEVSNEFSPEMVNSALKALLGRSGNYLGKEAMLGRWDKDIFVAVIELASESLVARTDKLEKLLNGIYAVQSDGLAHKMNLSVSVKLVERTRGMGEAQFYPHLGQATTDVVSRLTA